jgi:predicted HicB family RNase H-like nuclease
VTRGFKSHLQHQGRTMNKNTDYEKLVMHISREMHDRLLAAAEKNKLSIGSVIRNAIGEYLDNSEKKGTK